MFAGSSFPALVLFSSIGRPQEAYFGCPEDVLAGSWRDRETCVRPDSTAFCEEPDMIVHMLMLLEDDPRVALTKEQNISLSFITLSKNFSGNSRN